MKIIDKKWKEKTNDCFTNDYLQMIVYMGNLRKIYMQIVSGNKITLKR